MSSQHSIANMEGLQSSIVRGEADRVAELLGSQKLDELQKSYLLELAEVNGNSEVIKTIQQAPTK